MISSFLLFLEDLSVVLIVVLHLSLCCLFYFLMKRLVLARSLAAKDGTDNGDLIR